MMMYIVIPVDDSEINGTIRDLLAKKSRPDEPTLVETLVPVLGVVDAWFSIGKNEILQGRRARSLSAVVDIHHVAAPRLDGNGYEVIPHEMVVGTKVRDIQSILSVFDKQIKSDCAVLAPLYYSDPAHGQVQRRSWGRYYDLYSVVSPNSSLTETIVDESRLDGGVSFVVADFLTAVLVDGEDVRNPSREDIFDYYIHSPLSPRTAIRKE